jgi:guanylate kinase
MSIRHQRIVEAFPEIPADHILMGSRKGMIDVDILFDDGMHNVFRSNAAYPILMRRPWNREATGILAVNNYDEFLKLVEVIAGSYNVRTEPYSMSKPSILVLVGPSGSGKNEVAEQLMDMSDRFEKLVSYTTDCEAASRSGGRYHHVPLDQFHAMQESGEIFESTTYAHQCYGSRKSDVEQILTRGKHVLTVMDICGAMSLKTHFDNVITVYVKRDKKELLSAVLEENMPTEEKVNRIIAMDAEMRNASICDYVVQFENGRQAAEEICRTLEIL